MDRPPIYDNHIHLSPEGLNIEALKLFEQSGGTGLTLVTLPYASVPISSAEDFIRSFQVTFSMAERGRDLTSLKINTAVGPYPIYLIGLAERFGLEKAESMMIGGMEVAAKMVEDGHAVAIGEVGRPHFPVSEEIIESSNRILIHGMELASRLDCAIIIHSESATPETMAELSEMARCAGLDPGKVVKHFCSPLNDPEESHGIIPSVPASRSLVRTALSKKGEFLLETDYIDDPDRPGAIMSVNTVPKRVKSMLLSREMPEETAWRIGSDIPSLLYDRKR